MINKYHIVDKIDMLYAQAYICKKNQLNIRILKFQTQSEQILQDIRNYYTCIQKYDGAGFQKIIEIQEESYNKQIKIIYIVFQRVEGRSLIDLIKHNQTTQLNIFNSLKSIVDYLYLNTKLIHGNINSSNIILKDTNKIILINPIPFKQIVLKTKDHNFLRIIESYYMAPEIYYKSEYNDRSDYWSIGIILMEMSLKQDIIYITKHQQINHPLINQRFPQDELKVCKQYTSKIQQCLKIDKRGEQQIQEQNLLNMLLENGDDQQITQISMLSQRQRQLIQFHPKIDHINFNGKDIQIFNKLKFPKQISKLTLNNFENFDLLDLRNIVNVKVLDIKLNKFKQDKTILPISKLFSFILDKLITLQIKYVILNTSISFQSKLISLKKLSLNDCRLSNIVFLTKLDAPDLSYLALCNNLINNIEPLCKCTFSKLKQLYLYDNSITELRVMNYWEFPILYQANFNECKITDYSYLHKIKFPRITTWLNIDNNRINLYHNIQTFLSKLTYFKHEQENQLFDLFG